MLGNKGTKKFYRTGGTRGGADQFNWDDVKGDRERENYLGHSQMAPVGRWQNGKDLFWYTKKNEESINVMRAEIDAIKARDEDMINSALGLKRSARQFTDNSLAKDEIKQLFSRGTMDRASIDIERVEGLGAAPTKGHEHIVKGPTAVEKEIALLRGEHPPPEASSFQVESIGGGIKRRHRSDNEDDDARHMKKAR